jgi:hypothetical protein
MGRTRRVRGSSDRAHSDEIPAGPPPPFRLRGRLGPARTSRIS